MLSSSSSHKWEFSRAVSELVFWSEINENNFLQVLHRWVFLTWQLGAILHVAFWTASNNLFWLANNVNNEPCKSWRSNPRLQMRKLPSPSPCAWRSEESLGNRESVLGCCMNLGLTLSCAAKLACSLSYSESFSLRKHFREGHEGRWQCNVESDVEILHFCQDNQVR